MAGVLTSHLPMQILWGLWSLLSTLVEEEKERAGEHDLLQTQTRQQLEGSALGSKATW